MARGPRYSRIFSFSHSPPKPTSISRQRRPSFRRFDHAREIPPPPPPPPPLSPLSSSSGLCSSLSSELPPIGILKFNSGAKAEATGWTDGRGRRHRRRRMDVPRLHHGRAEADGRRSVSHSILQFLLPHSHVNVTATAAATAGAASASEWMRQRGNYSSLVPSSSETSADHRPTASASARPSGQAGRGNGDRRQRLQQMKPIMRIRPSVRPSAAVVHSCGPFLAFNYDIV